MFIKNLKNPKLLFKNSLVKGGVFFFVLGFLANVLNYFYRVFMGRLLTPSQFGELTASISLLLILSSVSSPLKDTVTRLSAKLKAEDKVFLIKKLVLKFLGLIFIAGFLLFTAGFLFSGFFVSLFGFSKPSSFYLVLTALFFMLLSSVMRGVLSGLCQFVKEGAVWAGESFLRLAAGVGLVGLGYGLAGALAGYSVSYLFSLFLAFLFLQGVLAKNNNAGELEMGNGALRFALFSFLALFFLNVLAGLDIIFVKRFFPGEEAGVYAGFATLGRVVLILSQLLGGVLFPLSAFRKENGQDYLLPLKIVLAISFIFCVGAAFFIFFLPELIFNVFFGGRYVAGAGFLGWHGLIMGGLGLLWSLTSFEKGVNRFYFLFPLAGGAAIEFLFISFFHQTFGQVLLGAGLGTGTALLGSLGLTYLLEAKKHVKVSYQDVR